MSDCTVLLIDRRHLTRECLAKWLSMTRPSMEVHAFAQVAAAIEADIPMTPQTGTILLNTGSQPISAPDVTEDLAVLKADMPGIPIILIADQEDSGAVLEALSSGLRGYVPTTIDAAVLVGAIQLVQAGGTFVPASALSRTPQTQPTLPAPSDGAIEGFTPRQAQVLACLRQGKPNKTIAYELDMCESTVKVHVRHIMKKLRATNRTQVAFLTNQLFAQTGESGE